MRLFELGLYVLFNEHLDLEPAEITFLLAVAIMKQGGEVDAAEWLQAQGAGAREQFDSLRSLALPYVYRMIAGAEVEGLTDGLGFVVIHTSDFGWNTGRKYCIQFREQQGPSQVLHLKP